jgi:hypothetical protein
MRLLLNAGNHAQTCRIASRMATSARALFGKLNSASAGIDHPKMRIKPMLVARIVTRQHRRCNPTLNNPMELGKAIGTLF